MNKDMNNTANQTGTVRNDSCGRVRPMPLAIFPESDGYAVSHGERHCLVTMIQVMLDVLKLYYDTFGALPVSGVYDSSTADAVKEFQRANNFEQTGVVNLQTWNALAEEFNSALWENH